MCHARLCLRFACLIVGLIDKVEPIRGRIVSPRGVHAKYEDHEDEAIL